MRLSLVLLLAASPQAASPINEEPPVFREPPACWSGSQHELTVCASKELQHAEVKMNAQLELVAAAMRLVDKDDPPRLELSQISRLDSLKNSQKAWIEFRTAQCAIFGTGLGSMKPMLAHLCQRDLTLARTKQLEEMMKNPATGRPWNE